MRPKAQALDGSKSDFSRCLLDCHPFRCRIGRPSLALVMPPPHNIGRAAEGDARVHHLPVPPAHIRISLADVVMTVQEGESMAPLPIRYGTRHRCFGMVGRNPGRRARCERHATCEPTVAARATRCKRRQRGRGRWQARVLLVQSVNGALRKAVLLRPYTAPIRRCGVAQRPGDSRCRSNMLSCTVRPERYTTVIHYGLLLRRLGQLAISSRS